MRVLFLTSLNVSNVHYMLARILKARGVETAFLDVREALMPKRALLADDSREWHEGEDILGLDRRDCFEGKGLWGRLRLLFRLVDDHDFVFVSGWAALFPLIICRPYVYFVYGSDLDQCTRYGTYIFKYLEYISGPLYRKLKLYPYFQLVKTVFRQVIARAPVAVIAPHQYSDLMDLGFRGKPGFFPHPLHEDFLSISLNDKEHNRQCVGHRLRCDRYIFSSTRHVWRDELLGENDYKGNDVFIRAFHRYIAMSGDMETVLVFIEKGPDVDLSKKLIADLGMEERVRWIDKLPRTELLRYYSGADVCFDQFSIGCFTLCAVESMACGTATVSYIGSNPHHVPWYNTSPPLFNSKDEREIAGFLHSVMYNGGMKKEMEDASYQWVRENCSHAEIEKAFVTFSKQLTPNT